MIKKCLATACASLMVVGLLSGCGHKAGADSQVFDSAAPDIKQSWDNAAAADKANDYVTAVTGYNQLLAQKDKLTSGEVEAVNAAALAINQRMYAAANNGDAAAKDAQTKLAQMESQRR